MMWFFLFCFVCFGGGNEIREDDRNEGKKRWELCWVLERESGEREKRGEGGGRICLMVN